MSTQSSGIVEWLFYGSLEEPNGSWQEDREEYLDIIEDASYVEAQLPEGYVDESRVSGEGDEVLEEVDEKLESLNGDEGLYDQDFEIMHRSRLNIRYFRFTGSLDECRDYEFELSVRE